MWPSELRDDFLSAEEAEQDYLTSGDRAALGQAVIAWGRILNHPAFTTAPEHLQLAAFNDAGAIFLHRYEVTGQLEDLNQAVALLGAAAPGALADSPDLPSRRNKLGNGLRDRYTRTARLEDLAEAIHV